MSETAVQFSLTEQMAMVQAMARDFAEKEIKPHVTNYDESQEFPVAIFKKMAGLGFLGVYYPEEYGGAGLTVLDFTVIVEEIAKVDPSVALGLCAHNGLCISHIYNFASEALKEKYLPDLCSGKKIGGWGLTEAFSGSDAGGMRTTAVKEGNEWVINGSKNFITHGITGQTFVILAVTDKTKNKSISAFIVEKGTSGFSSGKKENKLGMRCSETATLLFDNVRIPEGNLIGNVGEGFKQALNILDGGRIGIAALAVGLAQGAMEASIKYAKERIQFGRPIADNQGIQFKLADMSMEIEAARLLIRKAASMRMAGKDVNLEAAQAKYFASEVATRAANDAVQIHGGYGFTKDYPVEKFYRDVKLLTIGEGTSEVQKMVIARNLLK
ncbi:MAG: acyl-CoA dehydrogenase family protein [Bacteriovoracaceae bacterium]